MSVNAYDPTTDSLILLAAGTKKTNTVLTVTTDISRLYGETVTVTDGKETLTGDFSQTGRVVFELGNLGTYTITCDDYSTSVSNEDYGSNLSAELAPTIASWSTGTDEEIEAMISSYYKGDLSLSDVKNVWSIGDARTVSLSAMSATGVSESHAKQDVQLEIIDFDFDTLATPIGSISKALITVDQKNCLAEAGYMHDTLDPALPFNWGNTKRRTWCNNVYRNALPSSIKSLVKQVSRTYEKSSADSTLITLNDYIFFLKAENIAGTYSPATEETYEYYKTITNLIKNTPSSNPKMLYWLSDPLAKYGASNSNFPVVYSASYIGTNNNYPNSTFGINPVMCI